MIFTLQDFQARLMEMAKAVGWEAGNDPLLVSDRFRGREMSEGGSRPPEKLGVRLGPYPVILAPILLEENEQVATEIRALHSQVLIARSYLPARSIVDLHLFIFTQVDRLTTTQVVQIDRIERDEKICRKQMCVIQEDLEKSVDLFVERTFLARPWETEEDNRNVQFQLDQPTTLVRQILTAQGLSPAVADAWVKLADDYIAAGRQDPTGLVDTLVNAAESDNG